MEPYLSQRESTSSVCVSPSKWTTMDLAWHGKVFAAFTNYVVNSTLLVHPCTLIELCSSASPAPLPKVKPSSATKTKAMLVKMARAARHNVASLGCHRIPVERLPFRESWHPARALFVPQGALPFSLPSWAVWPHALQRAQEAPGRACRKRCAFSTSISGEAEEDTSSGSSRLSSRTPDILGSATLALHW